MHSFASSLVIFPSFLKSERIIAYLYGANLSGSASLVLGFEPFYQVRQRYYPFGLFGTHRLFYLYSYRLYRTLSAEVIPVTAIPTTTFPLLLSSVGISLVYIVRSLVPYLVDEWCRLQHYKKWPLNTLTTLTLLFFLYLSDISILRRELQPQNSIPVGDFISLPGEGLMDFTIMILHMRRIGLMGRW